TTLDYPRRHMDIDAFVVRHQASWSRLGELTRQARKPKSLSPDQLDELIQLYQRAGAQLADARVTYAADQALVGRLTLLVADAHTVLYSQREVELRRGLRHFATVTFPTAVWSIRRFVVASALLTAVPWLALNIWLAISPRAVNATGPATLRDQYIHGDFENYYRSASASSFAQTVFWNNVRVAILAFAAGILLCVVTALLLAYNGANVGIAGGLFTNVGEWQKFWGLILPHGMLELSAVIVAGAAGLRIGWTVIDPGDRSRLVALGEEGRRAGTVVIGLVVAFLMAATIEGFVTGQPWPTPVRLGIGVVGFMLFWGWTIAFGVRQRRIDRDEVHAVRRERIAARTQTASTAGSPAVAHPEDYNRPDAFSSR
ncbi:MAG TPA: stage II sporulation protein M, partial [Ilumatobacteraceae bacterium]